MSLLAVAVAGTALGSSLLYKSRAVQSHAQEQRAVLDWAHQAVRGFAVAHGRLPCPAISRSGEERCEDGRSQGWLPVKTLIAMRGGSHAEVPDGMAVRYWVNAPSGVARSTDVCAMLQAMPGFEAPWEASRGALSAAGAPAGGTPGVYGLAAVEPGSAEATDAGYRGMSSSITPMEMHEATGCGAVAASLDTMAMVSAWTEVAASTRQGNIEKGQKSAEMNDLGVMSDGFYLVDAGTDLINGIYNAGDNAAKAVIAEATPTLAPYVPVHVSGIAKAGSGMLLSVVDTARNAVTFALRIMHAQAFRNLARAATEQPTWDGAGQMRLQAHEMGITGRAAPLGGLKAADL